MKTYFTIGQLPLAGFVGFMLMKIIQSTKTSSSNMSFDYLALREIFFEKLGIVTAYTQRLVKSFRVSWRNHFWLYAPRQATLSQSAPDIAHAPPKVDLSPFFSDYDRQLTSSLAVIMIQTAADPARHDAEGEAVCRDKRFRRSNSNFLHKGMCATILTTPTTKN